MTLKQIIDVNTITTDMTEVLKYVLVLNFKKRCTVKASYKHFFMTAVEYNRIGTDCGRALEN